MIKCDFHRDMITTIFSGFMEKKLDDPSNRFTLMITKATQQALRSNYLEPQVLMPISIQLYEGVTFLVTVRAVCVYLDEKEVLRTFKKDVDWVWYKKEGPFLTLSFLGGIIEGNKSILKRKDIGFKKATLDHITYDTKIDDLQSKYR